MSKDPTTVQPLLMKADDMEVLGNYEDALIVYNRVLQLDTECEEAREATQRELMRVNLT